MKLKDFDGRDDQYIPIICVIRVTSPSLSQVINKVKVDHATLF
jgi:hypothetical protein